MVANFTIYQVFVDIVNSIKNLFEIKSTDNTFKTNIYFVFF